jgi:acetolactate decarboxylase
MPQNSNAMRYCGLYLLALVLFGCRYSNQHNDETLSFAPQSDLIYQYSIMDALLAGVFDGNLRFGELRKKGDFGIGAFNRLDGEMLMIDGKVYKMRFNGEIKEVTDNDSTSLAFVKFFKADTSLTITGKNISYEQLKAKLDSILNRNNLYAIKLRGKFSNIDARSVAPSEKPYPELSAHIAKGGQTDFQFKDVQGVCVGFSLPAYMARVNVPGYHVHFISDGHDRGGHVFEFSTDSLYIEIDKAEGYTAEINTNQEFNTANLNADRQDQLKKVE